MRKSRRFKVEGVTVHFEDSSHFTGEDLEGRRLTLRLEGMEGTAGIVELGFGEGNRFEQIELGVSPRSGTYTYEKTDQGMGTITLNYDDGPSGEIHLSFTESGVGAFAYDCADSDPAEGSFQLTTESLYVPVILSSAVLPIRAGCLRIARAVLMQSGDPLYH